MKTMEEGGPSPGEGPSAGDRPSSIGHALYP